VENELIASV
jgi:hypothetical protein